MGFLEQSAQFSICIRMPDPEMLDVSAGFTKISRILLTPDQRDSDGRVNSSPPIIVCFVNRSAPPT